MWPMEQSTRFCWQSRLSSGSKNFVKDFLFYFVVFQKMSVCGSVALLFQWHCWCSVREGVNLQDSFQWTISQLLVSGYLHRRYVKVWRTGWGRLVPLALPHGHLGSCTCRCSSSGSDCSRWRRDVTLVFQEYEESWLQRLQMPTDCRTLSSLIT